MIDLKAARNDPDKLWRVRQGRLSVWYAWLIKWNALREECLSTKATWPLPLMRQELADRWLSIATGPGPDGWSGMTRINESGTTPETICKAGWERKLKLLLGYDF